MNCRISSLAIPQIVGIPTIQAVSEGGLERPKRDHALMLARSLDCLQNRLNLAQNQPTAEGDRYGIR